MTPDEFAGAMRKCLADSTSEHQGPDAHEDMDEVMARTLRALGYGEGIDVYETAEKWYE